MSLSLFSLIFFLTVSGTANPKETPCPPLPELNEVVIRYTNEVMGQRIGSGQCWDFPAEAMHKARATWDGLYLWGRRVDPWEECVYPGDIMQFEGVRIEYERDGGQWVESMGHHSAVIYKVNGPGNYELAHQNYGPQRKKVGITTLNLKHVVAGEYSIFRPER